MTDGVSSTQTVVGSDTVEDTENTTVLVQLEEEKRVIWAIVDVVRNDIVIRTYTQE